MKITGKNTLEEFNLRNVYFEHRKAGETDDRRINVAKEIIEIRRSLMNLSKSWNIYAEADGIFVPFPF